MLVYHWVEQLKSEAKKLLQAEDMGSKAWTDKQIEEYYTITQFCDFYSEGFSPADAVSEDMSYWEE